MDTQESVEILRGLKDIKSMLTVQTEELEKKIDQHAREDFQRQDTIERALQELSKAFNGLNTTTQQLLTDKAATNSAIRLGKLEEGVQTIREERIREKGQLDGILRSIEVIKWAIGLAGIGGLVAILQAVLKN